MSGDDGLAVASDGGAFWTVPARPAAGSAATGLAAETSALVLVRHLSRGRHWPLRSLPVASATSGGLLALLSIYPRSLTILCAPHSPCRVAFYSNYKTTPNSQLQGEK